MKRVELTRKFTFEAAHALAGYDGLCRQIHGHSYKLYVTVSGAASTDPADPKLGMVIDFSDLKKMVGAQIVDQLDHALVVRAGAYAPELLAAMRGEWERIIELPYQPTCENMVVDFAERIAAQLPDRVRLTEVKLYETENSYAAYRPE